MSETAKAVQNALSTQQHSLLFSYTDNLGSTQSEIRKFLAQSNLRGTSSSLRAATFELFDNWTFASTIHRVQFIPNDTWKRIALFVSLIVVAYYLHGECESYFSLPFLLGAPLMLYALRKTYLYVKNGTFPNVLQVTLSQKEITPIKHDILANGTDSDGHVVDMFSLEPIPKEEQNSGKYLHLPNYIIETTACLHGLLGKPELKHPIEPKRAMNPEELKMFLPQITRIFNITEEEFLSCWQEIKASEEEKDALLADSLEDGKLSSEAIEHLRANLGNIVREIEGVVQFEVARITRELQEQALTRIGIDIDFHQQKCMGAVSLDAFQDALVELLSVISSLDPIKVVVQTDSHPITVKLNSSVREQQLLRLQNQLGLQSFFGTSTPQAYSDLVGVQLAEAKEAQAADLKPLQEFLFSKALIPVFKATKLFQDKVIELEANKRFEKFKALTGIDVKASDA